MADVEARLNVIESNNLESLADMCAMIMSNYPLSDVFMAEKIVVMNLGMKNFLTQRITLQNKISAMCDFTQVWQLIFSLFYDLNSEQTQQLKASLGPKKADSLAEDSTDERYNFYDRSHMKWNIYSQICLRPKRDLEQFVHENEANGDVERIQPLKFFASEGAYTIAEAKKWLSENADPADAAYATQADQAAFGAKMDAERMWSFVDLDQSELFDRIKDYVHHDQADERAFELAAKIADTFDQYQIYRPEWILAWNKFTLDDFTAYELNPDDPKNPINLFIDGQCQRYAQRKSGLIAANRRKYVNELEASGEGSTDLFSQDAASSARMESSLAVSELKRAQAAFSEAEQEQAALQASVEAVRNTFKQNVWQMKLWCLLRPGLALPLDVTSLDLQNKQQILTWFLGHLDRAQVLYSLIDKLEHGQVTLPYERVFIFGVSALPKVVIDFFQALSKHCQVFLMLLNPSHLFWADIRSEHKDSFKDFIQHVQATRKASKDYKLQLKRKMVRMPSLLETLKRQDYDSTGERIDGHPLLLAYGKQCKDMLNMLLDLDPPISSIACFSDPLESGEFVRTPYKSDVKDSYDIVRGGTLLKYLQTTIFNLDEAKERYEISPHDRSLVVHSCFTLRREVEVLKDSLLRLFNEHRCPYRLSSNRCSIKKFGKTCEYCTCSEHCSRNELLPRDIVVMVPAINSYAPHISAVFGGVDPSAPDYIPFVISDQTETEANTVASALLRLLEINSERITSVMVIELLNEPAIARRFGISADDVDVISSWLTLNNVYWGLDDADAKKESEIDVPGTFSHGLDRMLLGSLVGEAEQVPCFTEIEGGDARLLGKFWDFIQALRELRTYFTPELQQSPDDWQRMLQEKLRERFFDDADETVRALRSVDDFISNLKYVFSHLKKAPRLTLKVFASALRQGLTAVRNFTPYYGERVNFCSLIPMRAVPFKHVFILGLNDSDFPRQNVSPAFNIIGTKEMFERGDRSPALDDRFLFLEALLSARESLYLSYLGQSPIDQSERNPSLVLSELLYYISDKCQLPLPEDPDKLRAMELDLGKAVLERIVIKERLNAYHVDNYQLSPFDRGVADTYKGANKATLAAEGSAAEQVRDWAPYETVVKHNPVWRLPSFNRSFINLQQSIHCEMPILGAGNFGALVGLPEQQVIDLKRILAFCKKPCKSFMQSKLRLSLDVDNKTELSSDELFSYDLMRKSKAVGEMVERDSGLQEAYIEHLSDLGAMPYGVFKDILKDDLLQAYNKILGTLAEFNLTSSQQIEQRPSARHYEIELKIPESAIYGNNPISPREILQKYNADTATTLFSSLEKVQNVSGDPDEEFNQETQDALNSVAGVNTVTIEPEQGAALESGTADAASGASGNTDAGAMGQAEPEIPSILDQDSEHLSKLEKARARSIAPDGEGLLHLHVTLQFDARTLPIVIDHFGAIKAKCLEGKKKPNDWEYEAMSKDYNLIFNALSEAIAQYLYEPVENNAGVLEKDALNPEVTIGAAHLPKDSPLHLPACTSERLQDVTIIDRNGRTASFTKFSSGEELIFILKQLVIFYLQASCAPYPSGRYIMSNLMLTEDGLQLSNKQDVDPNLSFDREAAYFFGNIHNILGNELLAARTLNFMRFINDDLLPHYHPGKEL